MTSFFKADRSLKQHLKGILGDSREPLYESFATVGEIRVWWRADFQSGSRVLKKVF